MSQPHLKKLKSGSQKKKLKKDRERRQNETSQVLTNLFSRKAEHKCLNTQDETPFFTTSVIVAKTNRDNPKQEQTIGYTFKL